MLQASIKIDSVCVSLLYDDFYLTSRVQNAIVREPTRLWYFLGGRMESPKHSWLNIKSHLKQIQITISQDHISVQKKNTCINGKKENRWQKVLDNMREKFGSPHLHWHGIYSLKIGYYMTCIAHLTILLICYINLHSVVGEN